MVIAVIAGCLVCVIVGFFLGLVAAAHMEFGKTLREAGLTKDAAKLYGRAVKILKRLANLRDFDGDLTLDHLSPETEKQVTEWLADYRKLVNK